MSHQNSRQLVITTSVFFVEMFQWIAPPLLFSNNLAAWCRSFFGQLSQLILSAQNSTLEHGGGVRIAICCFLRFFFLGEFGGFSVGCHDVWRTHVRGNMCPSSTCVDNNKHRRNQLMGVGLGVRERTEPRIGEMSFPKKKANCLAKVNFLTPNKGSIRFNWKVKIFLDEIFMFDGIPGYVVFIFYYNAVTLAKNWTKELFTLWKHESISWFHLERCLAYFLGISGHLPMK